MSRSTAHHTFVVLRLRVRTSSPTSDVRARLIRCASRALQDEILTSLPKPRSSERRMGCSRFIVAHGQSRMSKSTAHHTVVVLKLRVRTSSPTSDVRPPSYAALVAPFKMRFSRHSQNFAPQNDGCDIAKRLELGVEMRTHEPSTKKPASLRVFRVANASELA